MNKKLTISVDDATIEKAKQFAKSKGQSLSELVENYLKLITRKPEKPQVSSKISKLKGTVKLSAETEYKNILKESISDKYLK
ncbi:DUF6364 family protein [Cytophagaceae bacterium ABcell3]|nr:DUF6364 family protein [Cytophagaceae bacterium ABcell3]